MAKLEKILKSDNATLLFEAILSLSSVEDCQKFFRDLMTEQEIEVFSSRFKAAVMLTEGTSYRTIAKKTGMSTATITRINAWLTKGMNGYTKAIKTLVKSKKLSLHHHHKI